VNYYRVLKTIMEAEQVNVVIPAAGQGKRFSEAGYQHPQPLIDVAGKPMIQVVVVNFFDVGRLIFILQKKHIDQYCADAVVKHLSPGSEVVHVDGLTEGAVCTVLKAKDLINNGNELVIANSDPFVDMDVMDFVRRMRRKNADGGILTFVDDNPKWCYARTDDSGRVSEVAEKVVISNQATVGIYYYRRGSDFVKYAEQMIRKNIRVNNEFYVCPVFNEFIADGKAIFTFEIGRDCMHGLGTPEDLERFTTRINEAIAA
jgi:NDP-sugar pyrophosphorylase family protein